MPALLRDNPHIDQASYVKSLNNLDGTTRKQLLEGSWEAAVGKMFNRRWFKIIEKAQAPTDIYKVRYWDLASTEPAKGKDPDWTAGAKIGVLKGNITFLTYNISKRPPRALQTKSKLLPSLMVETRNLDGRRRRVKRQNCC